MTEEKDVTLRISISKHAHTELTILGMRKSKKLTIHEVIKDILEKYAEMHGTVMSTDDSNDL